MKKSIITLLWLLIWIPVTLGLLTRVSVDHDNNVSQKITEFRLGMTPSRPEVSLSWTPFLNRNWGKAWWIALLTLLVILWCERRMFRWWALASVLNVILWLTPNRWYPVPEMVGNETEFGSGLGPSSISKPASP